MARVEYDTENESVVAISVNLLLVVVLSVTIHPKIVNQDIHEKIYRLFSKIYLMNDPKLLAIITQSMKSLNCLVNRQDSSESSIGSLFCRSFLPLMVTKVLKMGQELHRFEKGVSINFIEDTINTLICFQKSLAVERLGK